jgi:hypothetical protein
MMLCPFDAFELEHKQILAIVDDNGKHNHFCVICSVP